MPKTKSTKNDKTQISLEDTLKKIDDVRSKFPTNFDLPNVYLLHGDLTDSEMNSLYNHPKIKAMISFTHGEGYGRPLLEFGITGKPVIAPNWSGHVDFLSENGILLPGELKKVHSSVVWENVIIKESSWFYVDYGYASGLLKDIEKNYKKYLQKSRKQTQYIKNNLDLMKIIKLIKNNKKIKLMFLSRINKNIIMTRFVKTIPPT